VRSEATSWRGTRRGVDLPSFESLDWIRVRQPTSRLLLPIVTDLGAGEREVLALGVESADSIVILDDALLAGTPGC
jgi:predicted nucleic acid-binding protein